MWVYLVIAGVVVIVPYIPRAYRRVMAWIKLPLSAHRHPGITIEPNLRATEPEDLSPEIQDYIGRIVRKFKAEGFDVVANLINEGIHERGQRAIHLLLVDRATKDIASVVIVVGYVRKEKIQYQYRSVAISVGSKYVEGSAVTTVTSRMPRVYPRDPANDAINAGWVRDARVLCEFHRRRLKARGMDGRERTVPEMGQEISWLLKEREEEVSRMINTGYRYRDDATGRYRATWKGSILTSWRLTEPVKSWRKRRSRAKARQEWDGLKMAEWAPPIDPEETERAEEAWPNEDWVAGNEVGYQATLADGEVRVLVRPEGAIVRVGMQGRRPVVIRRVIAVGLLTTLATIIGVELIWISQSRAGLPPQVQAALRFPWSLVVYLILLIGLALWQMVRLVKSVRQKRESAVVMASCAGIRYRNLQRNGTSGEIRREEIHSLTVVRIRKFGALVVRVEEGKPLVLLVGRNPQDVDQARMALAKAMGMYAESDDQLEKAGNRVRATAQQASGR